MDTPRLNLSPLAWAREAERRSHEASRLSILADCALGQEARTLAAHARFVRDSANAARQLAARV